MTLLINYSHTQVSYSSINFTQSVIDVASPNISEVSSFAQEEFYFWSCPGFIRVFDFSLPAFCQVVVPNSSPDLVKVISDLISP